MGTSATAASAAARSTRWAPRTVALLAPRRQDLAAWKPRQGRPGPSALVFANAVGDPWKEHDWRNWRRRAYDPAAQAVGLGRPGPYDLRHSFASLLIHEGWHSIVDIAQQLGHNSNTCLSTYAHVIAELRIGPRRSAEAQIREAASLATDVHGQSVVVSRSAQAWSARMRRPRKIIPSQAPGSDRRLMCVTIVTVTIVS